MNDATLIRRTPSPLAVAIDDDLVFLSLPGNCYVTLDAIGHRIWELIEPPIRFGDLVATLEQQFRAPDGQVRADVEAFLLDIARDGLVSFEDSVVR